MKIRILTLVALFAAFAFGQGSSVNQTLGPPQSNWVTLFFCGATGTTCATGNTQVSYICYSPALAPPTTYAIGATPALTSIVVVANVGTINFGATAQLWVGQQVTVAGSTTAALNATYKLTAVSGSTATITIAGVADGTYNNAPLTVSTSGPRIDDTRWSLQAFPFTNAAVNASYFAGAPSVGVPSNLACSNRAIY